MGFDTFGGSLLSFVVLTVVGGTSLGLILLILRDKFSDAEHVPMLKPQAVRPSQESIPDHQPPTALAA
jgi:hypothetical protein